MHWKKTSGGRFIREPLRTKCEKPVICVTDINLELYLFSSIKRGCTLHFADKYSASERGLRPFRVFAYLKLVEDKTLTTSDPTGI
jgi:hypothetical protein